MKQRWQVAKKHLQGFDQKGMDRKSILQGQVSKIFPLLSPNPFMHRRKKKKTQQKQKREILATGLKQAIICLKWHKKFGFIFPIEVLSFACCQKVDRTRRLRRTVGSFVTYDCRKKSAGTIIWMSSHLILIPFRPAVDLEYSVSKHYMPYPDYSSHIWEILL